MGPTPLCPLLLLLPGPTGAIPSNSYTSISSKPRLPYQMLCSVRKLSAERCKETCVATKPMSFQLEGATVARHSLHNKIQ
jgi:hypothetical protein